MNIFDTSHALLSIEDRAKEAGLNGNQCVLFFMWLAEDKYPGHTFDDTFIGKLLADMGLLVKEFDKWAHKEALEALRNSERTPEPW